MTNYPQPPIVDEGQVIKIWQFTQNGDGSLSPAVGGGGGSNPAAGTVGASVPTAASYTGINIGGLLTGWTGFGLTGAKAAAVAIVDGSGNQITSFGGGTQFADNAASGAAPTGTLSMGWDSANSKVRALKVDASQNLLVALSGTVTVSGTVNIGNTPSVDVTDRSARLLGHVTVDNASLSVTQGTNPWLTQDAMDAAAGAGVPSKFGVIAGSDYAGTPLVHALKVDTNGQIYIGNASLTVAFASAQHVIIDSATLGNVNVTQGTSPWVDNLTQVAGVALGSTAVVNFGTAPAAVAVPAVNASLFSGVTGLTNTGSALDVNLKTSSITLNVQFPSAQHVIIDSASLGTVTISFSAPQHVIIDSATLGNVNVTQGTSPWVENVSQFGGNNVVTGVGISGAGIPRVTVSSDSFPATTAVVGPDTTNKLSTTNSVQVAGVDGSGFVRQLALDDAGNLAGNHQDLQTLAKYLNAILGAINNLNTQLNAMPVTVS